MLSYLVRIPRCKQVMMDGMMKKMLLASMLIVLTFSGCTERQLSAGEIRDQMTDSDKNLETYRFETDSVQKITAFATLYSDYNLPVEITLPEGQQLVPRAGCV
jgi:hypothetical protein